MKLKIPFGRKAKKYLPVLKCSFKYFKIRYSCSMLNLFWRKYRFSWNNKSWPFLMKIALLAGFCVCPGIRPIFFILNYGEIQIFPKQGSYNIHHWTKVKMAWIFEGLMWHKDTIPKSHIDNLSTFVLAQFAADQWPLWTLRP